MATPKQQKKKFYTEADILRAYRAGCSDGSGTGEKNDVRYMKSWDETQAENENLKKIINSIKS
jgi:hypothetical protein